MQKRFTSWKRFLHLMGSLRYGNEFSHEFAYKSAGRWPFHFIITGFDDYPDQ